MNLSYSLIDHFQSCQFRTKLVDFERVERREAVGDSFRMLLGTLAHAGQAAYLRRGDSFEAMREEIARRSPALPEGWTAERLLARVHDMVWRWSQSVPDFDPYTLTPWLIEERLIVPIDVGIFSQLVIVPDLVARDVADRLWLYDWKWVGALTEAEAYRYDLQSAIYQWGLGQLFPTRRVTGHAIVQGLLEEPTPFRVNKDGRVSTRPVRNSWEEYVAACDGAGHEPEPIMRERCVPTFRHHQNFRPWAEVEAIWNETVVPIARQISMAAEFVGMVGFPRRQSPHLCQRCGLREDCQLGQLRQHADPRFNQTHLARPASGYGSETGSTGRPAAGGSPA